MFFNTVKDLFTSFEIQRKSGKIQIGSKGEGVFFLGGPGKKFLARCQILRSKYNLYTVQQSVFQYSDGLFQII